METAKRRLKNLEQNTGVSKKKFIVHIWRPDGKDLRVGNTLLVASNPEDAKS